jgi:hypothetical protein
VSKNRACIKLPPPAGGPHPLFILPCLHRNSQNFSCRSGSSTPLPFYSGGGGCEESHLPIREWAGWASAPILTLWKTSYRTPILRLSILEYGPEIRTPCPSCNYNDETGLPSFEPVRTTCRLEYLQLCPLPPPGLTLPVADLVVSWGSSCRTVPHARFVLPPAE